MKCPICGKESVISSGKICCIHCGYVWGDLLQTTEKKSTDGLATPSNTGTATILNNSSNGFVQRGWQCPKCGAILSPSTMWCPFCSRQTFTPTITCGTSASGEYVNPNVSISISKEKE